VNIVHFLYDSPENPWLGGGGAIRAQEINQRLVAKGHEVHMICGGFPDFSHRDWIQNGVHWHSCHFWGNYALSRLFYSILCRRRFRQLQQQVDVDLVVDDLSAFSIVAPWLVWNGPFVGIVHHIIGTHARKRFPVLGFIIRSLEKWNIRKHSTIIAVSAGTAKQVQGYAKNSNVSVIYNGVSVPIRDHISDWKNVGSPFILFLGRMDRYNKGIDILINAFAKIADQFPEWLLKIVGSGKDLIELKNYASLMACHDQIEFLGRVDESIKIKLLDNAYVFCMPSRYEGWGIAAIESSARGCPVIASMIPGLNEAVCEDKTGIFVSPNDEDDLANKLKWIIDKSDVRNDLSQQGIEWAKTFSWDKIAEQQLELLKTQVDVNGRCK